MMDGCITGVSKKCLPQQYPRGSAGNNLTGSFLNSKRWSTTR
jgi:hypothetical protein